MYKEIAKTKTKTLYLIIGAVVLALILLSITGYIKHYRLIFQLAALIVLTCGVYSLIRYNLYIYEYHIIENELIFISKLGSAERTIAKVSFENVEYIAPYGHGALEMSKEIYRYNAKKSFTNKGVYVLVFFDERHKLSKLTFEPSEKLLSKLSEAGLRIYND